MGRVAAGARGTRHAARRPLRTLRADGFVRPGSGCNNYMSARTSWRREEGNVTAVQAAPARRWRRWWRHECGGCASQRHPSLASTAPEAATPGVFFDWGENNAGDEPAGCRAPTLGKEDPGHEGQDRRQGRGRRCDHTNTAQSRRGSRPHAREAAPGRGESKGSLAACCDRVRGDRVRGDIRT